MNVGLHNLLAQMKHRQTLRISVSLIIVGWHVQDHCNSEDIHGEVTGLSSTVERTSMPSKHSLGTFGYFVPRSDDSIMTGLHCHGIFYARDCCVKHLGMPQSAPSPTAIEHSTHFTTTRRRQLLMPVDSTSRVSNTSVAPKTRYTVPKR